MLDPLLLAIVSLLKDGQCWIHLLTIVSLLKDEQCWIHCCYYCLSPQGWAVLDPSVSYCLSPQG